jgi:starch synthase
VSSAPGPADARVLRSGATRFGLEEDGGLRILGLVEGDPGTALSGVARYLLDALDRRYRVVGRLDYAPHGIRRLALGAATFRPSRETWRGRYHASAFAYRVLSSTLRRRLTGLGTDFDLALQVHGWTASQPKPYALYVDQTRLMAERGWPEWLPLTRRERGSLIPLERDMYHRAFHIFVMGATTRSSLVDDYGLDPSRVTVVGGGLPFKTLPAPGSPSPRPAILFVGRDFERKGGEPLLRAFELVRGRVSDAELHLVGVARRIEREGVVNHGKVPDRDRLSELYRRARAFCLPSLYEPYGLVLIEAMAHGVPCVGTRVQAIPEILAGGEAGLLVPPGDPAGLAEQLVRLLSDERLAREIGAAGRRRVEAELTWDHVAARMAPALGAAARAPSGEARTPTD